MYKQFKKANARILFTMKFVMCAVYTNANIFIKELWPQNTQSLYRILFGIIMEFLPDNRFFQGIPGILGIPSKPGSANASGSGSALVPYDIQEFCYFFFILIWFEFTRARNINAAITEKKEWYIIWCQQKSLD